MLQCGHDSEHMEGVAVRAIGVRELKEHTSAILREVRDHRTEFLVTYRGREIARLIPAAPAPASSTEVETFLDEMDRIAAEIGKRWPSGVTAAEAVSEGRRSL